MLSTAIWMNDVLKSNNVAIFTTHLERPHVSLFIFIIQSYGFHADLIQSQQFSIMRGSLNGLMLCLEVLFCHSKLMRCSTEFCHKFCSERMQEKSNMFYLKKINYVIRDERNVQNNLSYCLHICWTLCQTHLAF